MKSKFSVKRYFQVLGIALAVIVAAGAVLMGFNYDKYNTLGGTVLSDVDNGKINILALGVDVEGLRTDAMMLFSFDTKTKDINVLTIPRDTRMYIGNRYQKINAAHAFIKNGEIGGPEASVEAVQRVTGVPINFYVEFSFDAVAHVINILGPIEFTIPDLYNDGVGMVYDDPVQSLHINLPPGKYGSGPDCDYPGLNGSQAVHLLRYRHGNYDPDIRGFNGYVNGDSDRTQVQQEFIKAVVDQKLNAALILKIPEIFQELESEIKTNAKFSDILKYAGNLAGVTGESFHSYTLPGTYGNDPANGDVWVVDIPATQELIQNVFGYDASGITIDNPDGTGGEGASAVETGESGGSDTTAESSYQEEDIYYGDEPEADYSEYESETEDYEDYGGEEE